MYSNNLKWIWAADDQHWLLTYTDCLTTYINLVMLIVLLMYSHLKTLAIFQQCNYYIICTKFYFLMLQSLWLSAMSLAQATGLNHWRLCENQDLLSFTCIKIQSIGNFLRLPQWQWMSKVTWNAKSWDQLERVNTSTVYSFLMNPTR